MPEEQNDLPEIEKEIETGIEDSLAASAPQPNPQIEDTQKKSNLLKYLVIFLLITITIAFVGTESYLMRNKSFTSENNQTAQAPSPTPNPTANWQTYSNNDYSVKYDSSWTVDTNTDPSITSIFDPKSLESFTGNGGIRSIIPTKYFTIKLIDSTQTPTEYADKIAADWKKLNTTITVNPIKVDELSGIIYPEAGEGSNGYNIIFSNGSKIALINVPVADPKQDQTIWNMLSSFKFTDSQNLQQGYIDIKELGIRLKLTDAIKDLVYTPKITADKTYIYLSTKSLVNAGAKEATNGFNNCSSDSGPLGAFSKVYKKGLANDPDQPWWNTLSGLKEATKDRTGASNGHLPASAKEFPDFFILYTSPQEVCGNNPTLSKLQSSALQAVIKTVPTIELVQ